MKKLINVDKTYNDMRIDRFLRNQLGQIPQSFIEKNLRNGKIKLNKKKIKSSHKVKTNDQIDLFNFEFKKIITQKKIKFEPSKPGEGFIFEKSIFTGVYGVKKESKIYWDAEVEKDGKIHYIGHFVSEREAALSVDEMYRKFGMEPPNVDKYKNVIDLLS